MVRVNMSYTVLLVQYKLPQVHLGPKASYKIPYKSKQISMCTNFIDTAVTSLHPNA